MDAAWNGGSIGGVTYSALEFSRIERFEESFHVRI